MMKYIIYWHKNWDNRLLQSKRITHFSVFNKQKSKILLSGRQIILLHSFHDQFPRKLIVIKCWRYRIFQIIQTESHYYFLKIVDQRLSNRWNDDKNQFAGYIKLILCGESRTAVKLACFKNEFLVSLWLLKKTNLLLLAGGGIFRIQAPNSRNQKI